MFNLRDAAINNTLKSERRLLNADHYRQVFNNRLWVISRYFKAYIKANKHNSSRLGLAVPKKICKRAVVRNRLKRYVRESFRCNQKLTNNIDIIVLPNQKSVIADRKELIEDLNLLWTRSQNSQ